MRMSKRQLGGVTWIEPGLLVQEKPSRVITCSQSACVTGKPITLAARSTRSVTGASAGRLTTWSSIGPHRVSELPQTSMMSDVMRSI